MLRCASMALSAEEARAVASAIGYPIVDDQVRESRDWWFFPVLQIGCKGVVVNKADGQPFVTGSAYSVDDWLWAYDRGLRDHASFVVTAVDDVTLAAEALVSIGVTRDKWWTRRSLASLPVAYNVIPWLPKLRALDPAPFVWHFVNDGRRNR
jgi:hypothetical protein